MNNDTYNTITAVILGILVTAILLLILNIGRAAYIVDNMHGVDSEGGVRRTQLEMQLTDIDDADELMSNKYMEDLR